MSVQAEVRAGEPEVRTITSKSTGKVYRKQALYVQLPSEPYPVKTFVWIRDQVLAPGRYVLDLAKSLKLNRYGELELDATFAPSPAAR